MPLLEREKARLLVVKRKEKKIEHRSFRDLFHYLSYGDLLVLNDTRVIPARLSGKKETGGRAEILLLRRLRKNTYEALARPRVKVGATISFNEEIKAKILEKRDGKYRIEFLYPKRIEEILEKIGEIPLPPYIKRKTLPLDREYYQTVYSKKNGAIAAPTAGLHFTEEFLQKVKEKGNLTFVTLNIGWGTFKPIRKEDIEEHRMEKEYFELSSTAAKLINKTKKESKKIIAVGTTAVRVLETAARSNGRVEPEEGWTSLYIYPGYRFKITDSILTNFHLPSTTLFLLVSAFAGKELIQKAYSEAIKRKYRFASYGDAMLIL